MARPKKCDILKNERLGQIRVNNNGCEMQLIEYKNANKIKVRFNDKYKAVVSTKYEHFDAGRVINPYYPSVYNTGISGNKYPIYTNNSNTKEYTAWRGIIQRCYDPLYKSKWITYNDVKCSDEWILYDNFYEWIISQENYEKWKCINRGCVDKDILFKGNKIYSSDTCTLVSPRINALFTKANSLRGNLPIGVMIDKKNGMYVAAVENNNKNIRLGRFKTIEEAFNVYKTEKEKIIQRVAKEEYELGNITKKCYEAMMNYEVEITD